MHKLCRIDIGRGKEIYKEIDNKLKELAKKVRVKYKVSEIIVFGGTIEKVSDFLIFYPSYPTFPSCLQIKLP